MTRRGAGDAQGQAAVLLLGIVCAVLVGAVVLGAVADAVTRHGDRQRTADLAALAAVGALRDAYPRLYPLDGGPPMRLAAYRAAAVTGARQTARANGTDAVTVTFPGGGPGPPMRVRVQVHGRPATTERAREAPASAEAELRMPAAAAPGGPGGAGEYRGPLAYRDGKPMRPDTALAYDRMAAAARADGLQLVVVSGWRSDAEQAQLFAAHPDPKWVARPGTSLHRLGTELDLGPSSAYGWLAANARRFGFLKRYSWEPWHFGLISNAGSTSVGYGGSRNGGDATGSSLPSYVPAQYWPILIRSAQRWNVSAALLGAQVRAESDFDPHSVSSAGAMGIAQLMPENVREMGVTDPFDPAQSINAHALHAFR
jgi:D-alanyl-D-alanine carboxypeptidase/Transglycosylase SLT domain